METTAPSTYWRKCTTCKKPIGFSQKYWICSVSTCNRQRTGLVFCSVTCFDAHIPVMNHRDAGAFEKRAPSEREFRESQQAEQPRASGVSGGSAVTQSSHGSSGHLASRSTSSTTQGNSGSPQEILVVVSKVKDYIRKKSGMNTSDAVMNRLTLWVTRWCDESIRMARQNERQTVMDRDVR